MKPNWNETWIEVQAEQDRLAGEQRVAAFVQWLTAQGLPGARLTLTPRQTRRGSRGPCSKARVVCASRSARTSARSRKGRESSDHYAERVTSSGRASTLREGRGANEGATRPPWPHKGETTMAKFSIRTDSGGMTVEARTANAAVAQFMGTASGLEPWRSSSAT